MEVADTLELIGGLEMTQGQLKPAHRTMTKVNTASHKRLCVGYDLEMLETLQTIFILLGEDLIKG